MTNLFDDVQEGAVEPAGELKEVEYGFPTYDFYKPHESPPRDAGEYSMARQEFAAECDINTIMERYQTTGALPANVREPVYVDFSLMPGDLMEAMEMMDKAQEAFMTLPARVRAEFGNNPAAFVDFASAPANKAQMQEWGLAPPSPAPEPPPAATPPADPPGGPTQSST